MKNKAKKKKRNCSYRQKIENIHIYIIICLLWNLKGITGPDSHADRQSLGLEPGPDYRRGTRVPRLLSFRGP